MVQGVDVWMNVRAAHLEASGTSGQKVGDERRVEFFDSRRWWIEGYNGENGFSIGDLSENKEVDETDKERQKEIDAADAESLYRVLENEIVPTFYAKDENGLPREWIKRMRNALVTLTPQFSSDRMVKDLFRENLYAVSLSSA